MDFFNSDYADKKFVDNLRVTLIYLFWFIAQIVLLVILLNFVIALISQFYEDVMNRRVMHQYKMYHELNKEYYNFNEFLVKMGWRKDDKIDAMILIDGEKAEN